MVPPLGREAIEDLVGEWRSIFGRLEFASFIPLFTERRHLCLLEATMQGGHLLFIVCILMGVCTYAVGTLPLAFQLSRRSLRKLELFGAGLLLGAAMTVVIPEGIQNVYSDHSGSGGHDDEGLMSPKDVVALCLLTGFLFMLIVHQQMVAHSMERLENAGAPVALEEQTESTVQWRPVAESVSDPWYAVLSGMLGILMHAVADGVAMGSSVESADVSLRLIVMIAVLVHKAPASIGICTLLMARQLPRKHIRMAIAVFAATTPISALLTYGILQGLLSATGSTHAQIGAREMGAILSFSGGTFLFVAIHAVMELASPTAIVPLASGGASGQHVHHPHDHDHPIHAQVTDGAALSDTPLLPRFLHESEDERESVTRSSAAALAYVVVGSFVPRLLQVFVGHAHHL